LISNNEEFETFYGDKETTLDLTKSIFLNDPEKFRITDSHDRSFGPLQSSRIHSMFNQIEARKTPSNRYTKNFQIKKNLELPGNLITK
jgi:hypothetical protein